jgi:hypothetical protein
MMQPEDFHAKSSGSFPQSSEVPAKEAKRQDIRTDFGSGFGNILQNIASLPD